MTDKTIETREIPGQGRGVVLASGELLNVSLASVKSLVRCGDEDFRRVLEFLQHERAKYAADRADRLAGLDEAAAKIRADAEARERNLRELRERQPWKFS